MTTTPTTLPFYDCPDWCERTDHHADEVGPGSPPWHYGPEFGACSAMSDGVTWQVHVVQGREAFIVDPAELRRLAADMLRAAEWLEAHQ